jgi:chromosome segregation ATPase
MPYEADDKETAATADTQGANSPVPESAKPADMLQVEQKSTEAEIDLEERIATENADLHQQTNNLEEERDALKEALDIICHQNEDYKQRIKNFEENFTSLNDEIEFLRTDNEKIRAYIAKRENDLKPVYAEDYYIKSFQELKAEIEMWVAKQSKTNATETLADIHAKEVLQNLAALGQVGRAAAKALNPSIQTWYGTVRSRIPLIRHVIAVFLFDQIFVPFAVGLSPEVSSALSFIEGRILSQGRFG